MKKVFLLLGLGILVYACGGEADTSSDATNNQNTTAAAEPEKPKPNGEKIYKQYCVACHGIYGDMGASGAANLAESTLPVEERIPVITKGRNVMTAFESLLEPEEIEAVAQYTMSLKGDD